MPGAVSGSDGHGQAFTAACALVHGFALSHEDARHLFDEYNQRCAPPWSAHEIEHKLASAESSGTHQKPKGHLISKSVRHTYGIAEAPHHAPLRPTPPAPSPAPAPAKRYEVPEAIELPNPLADGTRELIKAAFEPGEGVRLCLGATNDEGREVPTDGGVVLTREEWLRKLEASEGDPNKFLSSSKKNGIFISCNPLKPGGSKDSDVTAFRHALIECDSVSPVEQYRHIVGSGVPVTAVISSGGRSVHAWVRVDAKDRREYDERVKQLYAHFAANEFKIDGKNINPSRFSRLAGCVRGKKRQELLAIKIGAESWAQWRASIEVESIGRTTSIKVLRKFVPSEDPTTLLGERWVCEKGAVLFVGQSGIGKSSFSVQAAITWALGQPVFGIKPVRPLKSLFIQAENDDGDLSEMCQGVLAGLGIEAGSDEETTADKNVVFVSDASHTGEVFCKNVQRLIDKHRPNLVWLDPLLSFIGDDISKQSVCSEFLRTWLGPISEATKVAWMMMHHTGKPSNDPKSRSSWTQTDKSYSGIGSSELVNWARAVCVLERHDEETFSLSLAKRGKRAGALDIAGARSERLWLKHAPEGILWLQTEEPPKPVKEPKASKFNHSVDKSGQAPDEDAPPAVRDPKHEAPGRPAALDAIRPILDEFLGTWNAFDSFSLNKSAERLAAFVRSKGSSLSMSPAKAAIKQLVEEGKLTQNTVILNGKEIHEISL